MSDWQEIELGKIASVQSGYAFSSNHFITDGVPVIRMSDLENGRLNISSSEKLPFSFLNQFSQFSLCEGDLVVGMSGSLDNYAIVRSNDLPALLNQRVGRFVLRDPERCDYYFLYYLVCSNEYRLHIQRLAAGAAQKNVSSNQIESFVFKRPEKNEQRYIAKILSSVDKTIEHTESLIAKYQQIKAGMMHDLFTRGVDAHGRLRPPREQAPDLYKMSRVGWIPKEWDAVRLGKMLQDSGGHLQTGPFGSQLHAYEYTIDGVPVIMPQNIEAGQVVIDSIARIPEKRAKQLARHRLREGDIVIARRGELERAAAIRQGQIGWVCGTGCFILRLGNSILDPQFISLAYRHDLVQRQVAARAVGTTMLSLNNAVMESLLFPYMKTEEQKAISSRLSTAENKIESCEIERKKLQKIKHGLMHDLLTGRVRVKVPESDKQEAAA